MKRYLFAIMMLISSHSEAITGNELNKWLTETQFTMEDEAKFYIMGAIDATILYRTLEELQASSEKRNPNTNIFICMPSGAEYTQAFDLVKNYLKDHPEERHEHAKILIQKALLGAWRC